MLLIYIKRCLKHFGIVLLLLAIPFLAFIFRSFANKAEGAYVGIYNEGQSREVLDILLSSDDMLHFKEYDDIETMQNDVAVQKLECAFLLPDGIENITSGSIKMTCGTGYSSVLSEVTKEAVFAAVLKAYGDKIALDFAKKNNFAVDEQTFKTNYQNYLSGIESAVVFDEMQLGTAEKTTALNLTQCFSAVILLCAGLIGCTFFVRDRKNGIYIDGSAAITASLVLFTVSICAAHIILKVKTDTWLFVVRILLFEIGVWGLCSIIAHIFADERIIWLLMPVCICFAVLFDVANISAFIPKLRVINYFLPTHFYVYGTVSQLMLFAGICCLCGGLTNKLLRKR